MTERKRGGGSGNGIRKGDRKLSAADAPRVLKALASTYGIQTAAAQKLLVHPRTLTRFLRENPSIQGELATIAEETLDMVEEKLFAAIHRGDLRAVTFYLSTRGKARGYSTRIEQTGFEGGPIVHDFSPPSVEAMTTFLEKMLRDKQERDATSELDDAGRRMQ